MAADRRLHGHRGCILQAVPFVVHGPVLCCAAAAAATTDTSPSGLLTAFHADAFLPCCSPACCSLATSSSDNFCKFSSRSSVELVARLSTILRCLCVRHHQHAHLKNRQMAARKASRSYSARCCCAGLCTCVCIHQLHTLGASSGLFAGLSVLVQ